MKKIFVLLFLLITTIGAAQNGISYQAVLLNPNGEQLPGADNSKIPLVNSSICLRFSIAASSGGTPEYQETITTKTDPFGMVNVTIGTGNPTPGSPSFSTISWGSGPKNLKVELDLTGLCTSFLTVSDQPFTSVPFALYALNSGSGGGSSTTTLTGDVSGTGTGTIATSLATTGVIAGVYGSATAVPTITVDAKGRITSATTTPITGSSPIGSSLNNGNIIIGNNSNVATAVPVTGDFTITNAGVTAIGTGKVTDAKLDKTNIPLSGFGAAVADVDLGSNKLTNVTDPTLAQDAATKSYVDSATGAINTLADGKIYLGNASNVADEVTMNGDVTITNTGVTAIGTGKVTDAKLDKTNIPLSGFGAAVAAVDLGSNKLTNVTDPTLAQDAATKNYVDAATGAITTLADGKIYIGNASNVADEVTMNGDVTMTNAGVTAIGTGKVTDAKLDKTNIPLSGFGAAVADVDLGTKKLIGVANPTLAQDAATKSYVDSATGAINTLADGKIYLGNASNVADEVTMNGDVTITNTGVTAIGTGKVTDGKLDKTNIPLSGFGAAVAAVDLGSNKLTNVTDPTLAQDAATKNYVDAATGAITTLADGKIYIGNTSNVATEITMNGDVTISNTGATTIVPNAVTSTKIADANVTSVKIADSNITNSKLANDAVTTAKIFDGTIIVDDLAVNAVESTKIKDLNVTTTKLADAAITTIKIASGGNNKVLVTDNSGVVAWIDGTAFGAVADMTTIEGAGTTISPFKVKDLGIITAKLADNAVTTIKIADANVTSVKIADSNITNSKLANDAVTTAKIFDGTIIVDDLANNAVESTKIKDLNVTTTKLADAAITTTKIASGGNNKVLVTDNSGVVAWIDGTAFGAVADLTTIEGAGTTISPIKVKDLGIITTKLADNAVTTIKIADANVTNTKLANDAVNTAKILDGTIANADISPSAAIAYSKLNLASSIVVGDLADNAVETDKIKNGAVETAKLADGSITTVKLANDAVNTAKILDGTIANADISPSAAIAYSKLNLASSIVVGDLADNAVETDKIKNGAVETAKLADGSVTTVKLANDAVNTTKISDGTITNADISNTAAIQTSKIKGFYSGITNIDVLNNAGDVNIPIGLGGLNITEGVTKNATIIFQNNGSQDIYVKFAKLTGAVNPDGITYNFIKVGFNYDSGNYSGKLEFSYIIILNN